MLGRQRGDDDNVRGAGVKTARGRAADVDKARLFYTMASGPNGSAPNNPDDKGKQKTSILVIVAEVSGIIGGVIAALEFAESGVAMQTASPIVSALSRMIVAIGMAFGQLAGSTSAAGPLRAGAAVLFASIILRMLAERLSLFTTVSFFDAGREGLPILLMEYAVTCLLFLPLAATWIAAFYAVVPTWWLVAFGVAYLLAMLFASAVSAQVPQKFSRARLALGQLISILAGIGTTIVFTTQGLSLGSAPVHNVWVAAVTALIATIAVRFLLESLGLFATPRVRPMGVLFGWIILSPIPVLWSVAFGGTVPVWASALFVAAYLLAAFVGTGLSKFILFLVPPTKN